MKESNVKCMNPWDPQSKRQYGIDGVYATLNAGQYQGGQAHGICYAIDQQGGKSNCGYAEDVMMTLCSDSHGTPHALCYAVKNTMNAVIYDGSSVTSPGNWNNPKIGDPCYALHTDSRNYVVIALEGNTVDRSSCQSGKGWCENVIPTLNTQDRHAICYGIQGNVTKGSKQRDDGYYLDVCPTIIAGDCHAICFQLCGDRDSPSVSVSNISYCISANPMSDRGQAVCYEHDGSK